MSVVCPEDETGRSSVGPWTRPRATAWRSGSAPSDGRIGRRLALRPPPANEGIDHPDHDQRHDEVVDVLEVLAHVLPFVADGLAGQRQAQDPGRATRDREKGEAPERHPRDAGGQRYERPDDRKHTTEEDRRIAVALEPAVGPFDVTRLQMQPAPMAFD